LIRLAPDSGFNFMGLKPICQNSTKARGLGGSRPRTRDTEQRSGPLGKRAVRNHKEAFDTNMVKTEQLAGRRTTGLSLRRDRASMRLDDPEPAAARQAPCRWPTCKLTAEKSQQSGLSSLMVILPQTAMRALQTAVTHSML
jgi:hypothetical protein